jgi:hypothetical protein
VMDGGVGRRHWLRPQENGHVDLWGFLKFMFNLIFFNFFLYLI